MRKYTVELVNVKQKWKKLTFIQAATNIGSIQHTAFSFVSNQMDLDHQKFYEILPIKGIEIVFFRKKLLGNGSYCAAFCLYIFVSSRKKREVESSLLQSIYEK